MIIALDWDGVLHDRAHPAPGKRFGPPMSGAIADVYALQAEGHDVFVHTVMGNNAAGTKAVRDWLDYFGFPALEIVGKPNADYYVDDRALKFVDWPTAYTEITR